MAQYAKDSEFIQALEHVANELDNANLELPDVLKELEDLELTTGATPGDPEDLADLISIWEDFYTDFNVFYCRILELE